MPGVGRALWRHLRPADLAGGEIDTDQHGHTTADGARRDAQLRPASEPALRRDRIPGPAGRSDEDQDLAAADDEDRAAGIDLAEIDGGKRTADDRKRDGGQHAA